MWENSKKDFKVYQMRDVDILGQGYGRLERRQIQERFRR